MRRFRSVVLVLATVMAVWPNALLGGEKPSTQQTRPAAAGACAALTVDRIYSPPSLSGRLLQGVAWSPDGKHLSFFRERAAENGKKPQQEIWIMDAASGEAKVLVAAEKLATALPAAPGRTSQATGLGRRAPSEYQWAPDGSALLLQGATALVWFDLKGQTGRTLVSGTDTLADAKISPDGRYVSFVKDHNVWIASVADGKQRQVTRGGTEEVRKGELDWVYPEELDIATAYWWAPNSSAIAFLEMDERKVAQYPLVDFASFSGEADDERYPPAGGANPIVRVLVAALDGGEPRVMDTGADKEIYIPRVNWLPDSKRVAIQRLNREQTTLDLLIADADNGKSRVALQEKDQYWINLSDDLRFLKDGNRFLWSSERSGYRHLYLYTLEGKQLTQLTKGEWEVSALQGVDESAGVVYFTSTEKSPLERQLYRVELGGSGVVRTPDLIEQVTDTDGTHVINMAPSATQFVDTYSNSMTPPRQDLVRADGSKVALYENKGSDLAACHLSPVEFLQVKAHDGTQLNAMMIKPPNFDPSHKYPVLVYTYGGPHVQVVTNAWGGGTFLWHQMMAQKGYIIFSLDNRGSDGRGHLFEAPIHLRLGALELSDQRDGAAYLKSLSYVDSNRIGIWGWSYGGHMTLHAMFEAPEDFKVGFAGGPVTDWHFYDSIYTERYLGLLPQNAKSYQDSSPIKNTAGLKGKLLIAHGTGDDNVHFANTLALINELIEEGKYVEVMPFPGRGHGVSDPPARRLLMRRVTQFFLDNL
jgi:dipeptidyl-peptidase 4